MQKITLSLLIIVVGVFFGWQKYTDYAANKKSLEEYKVAAGIVCSSFVDRTYLPQESLMDCIRDKEVLQSGVDRLVETVGPGFAKVTNDSLAMEKTPTFIDLSRASLIDFSTAVKLGHEELFIDKADVSALYLLKDISLHFMDATDDAGDSIDGYIVWIEEIGSALGDRFLGSRPFTGNLAAMVDNVWPYQSYSDQVIFGDVYYRLVRTKWDWFEIEVLHFELDPISEDIIIASLRSDLRFRDLETELVELNPWLKKQWSDLSILNRIYALTIKEP